MGVTVTGVVVELLPSAMVRVAVEDRHQVVAHIPGQPDKNYIRLVAGDRVEVELSPYDPGRGRVTRKI